MLALRTQKGHEQSTRLLSDDRRHELFRAATDRRTEQRNENLQGTSEVSVVTDQSRKLHDDSYRLGKVLELDEPSKETLLPRR